MGAERGAGTVSEAELRKAYVRGAMEAMLQLRAPLDVVVEVCVQLRVTTEELAPFYKKEEAREHRNS